MMKEISKSNVFEVFINEKDKKKINGGRVTRSYINEWSEIVRRLKGKIGESVKKSKSYMLRGRRSRFLQKMC